ncbi:MAG TPA: hypothetical protein VMC10_16635 [Stellaceae bacterium]|nr:hypothetical protein [Stellaceae bacterium]
MPPAFDEPVPARLETAPVAESAPIPSDDRDALEPFPMPLDLGFRATTEVMLESARAWNRFSRAYMEAAEASRHAFGELMIEWRQRWLDARQR